MKKFGCLLVLFGAISGVASAETQLGAFNRIVVPTMANARGVDPSFFRTKVAIYNVTQQAYSIQAILYGGAGQVNIANIPMAAGQVRNYENFLEDVFAFSGAGSVVFDSQGLGRDFIVSSEVFNDLGAGRYKTVVTSGVLLENILPEFDSFSLGITVDANNRTNLGFFFDTAEPNTVKADVFDAGGTLVTTIERTVDGRTWNQIALTNTVVNGFVRWRVTGSAFCWAVVVDNKSADGTFIPAADYLP